MRHYRVSISGKIPAPPARVYGSIADYRHHHPHIVPPEHFPRLEVLEGGTGAGTRTRVEMRVLGATRVFEQVVTEPEPGRVLMETNQDGSGVTTFTVDECDGGESAQVTIATEFAARPGVSGFLERLVTSLVLPGIYRKEIARLAEYAARQRAPGEEGSGRSKGS
jgi:polyketide cyclase/dehydrase/lipid transport protein